MYSIFTVSFDGYTPSSATIVSKIKEMTGLEVSIRMISEICQIDHEGFKNFGSTLVIQDGKVTVKTGQLSLSYLFEATLAALVTLGGKIDVEINPLAFEKWIEVKNKYQNHKLVDWDGTWPEEEKGPWNT